MHVGSVSHLGTVIVPTLLSLAEATNASGKDFLTALVAGYEVGGKIGRMLMDVEVSKIFRPTGTVGPIAAAGAGAKLLGLTPSKRRPRSRSPRTWRQATTSGPARAAARCSFTTALPRAAP